MLFTEVEIDIAKRILKVGLAILLMFMFGSFLFKLSYGLKGVSLPEENVSSNITVKNNLNEAPLSVEIPDFQINTIVESPTSNDVDVLDRALGRSAVYYPGSGTPGSNNTLIFGHSTSFKVVINQAYKVFNNIKNVTPGTLVYVKTQSGTHIYRTREVKKVSKYTSWIQFKSASPMLTMATCDSFGKASDRWVLEADYVGIR